MFAQLIGGQMETQAAIDSQKSYEVDFAKIQEEAAEKKAEEGDSKNDL